MHTRTDGERLPDAALRGGEGAEASGRSIRPRNTTADRRKVPSWIGSEKRNFLSGYLFASGEVGYLKAAKAVLPHGVFEIPEVVLSAAYGLWLGATFAKRIRRRDMAGFGDQVIHGIRMFFKVAFPLFVLAALIETILIFSMGGGVPR